MKADLDSAYFARVLSALKAYCVALKYAGRRFDFIVDKAQRTTPSNPWCSSTQTKRRREEWPNFTSVTTRVI